MKTPSIIKNKSFIRVNLLFIFFLVLCFGNLFSQNNNTQTPASTAFIPNTTGLQQLELMNSPNFYDITKAYTAYWNSFPDGQRRGWKQYRRWEWLWRTRVDANGNFPDPLQIYKTYKAYSEKKDYNASTQAITWKGLGPFTEPSSDPNSAGLGRVNVIRFDPNNGNILWAGTAAGGAWKSTNGGTSWISFPFTEFLSLGIGDIAVAPSNSNIVYVATGDADGSGSGRAPSSIGLIKTTNGGTTWELTKLNYYLSDRRYLTRVLVDPDDPNIVIVSSFDGIFKSTDGGQKWVSKLSANGVTDMEMKPDDANFMYASTRSWSGTNLIYRSTDKGETWKEVKRVSSSVRIALGVTPANSDKVYALAASTSRDFNSFLVSADKGETWTTMSSRDGSNNILGRNDGTDNGTGQGEYDLALAISPFDENEIWAGGINIWRSKDGGASWTHMTHWYGGWGKVYVHADIHDLAYNYMSGDLVTSHDGGIDKTNNGGKSWKEISNGMDITQFYGLSSSATNANFIVAGAQDNGTNRILNNDWARIYAGDGMIAKIDYEDPSRVYCALYDGYLKRSTDGGVSFDDMLSPDQTGENGDWVTPYTIDPTNPSVLYAGYLNVWKSSEYGRRNTWTKISTWGSGYNTIRYIVVAPTDPSVIYATTGGELYATYDGGNKWTNIAGSARNISCIVVDPKNAKRIWVTNSGYDASSKVWEYDGTKWINLTGNMPNINVSAITYQKNSPDRLYIGTDVGVYYSDYESAFWEPHGTGLPNVMVLGIEIQESAKKLRVATYGRGLWEADLLNCNITPPEVNIIGKTEFCNGDSVILESKNTYPAYQWTTGETTKRIVVKTPGTYGFTINDPSGCKARSKAISVTIFSLPSISIKANKSLCEGDSVNVDLTASLGFASYLWSTGETSKRINVKKIGTYYVTGITSDGCSITSKTFEVKLSPFPAPPTITRVGPRTLQSTEAFGYQWYKDNIIIKDSTRQFIEIRDTGNYSVKVFNEAGCGTMSVPYQLISGVEDAFNADEIASISPNPGSGLYNLNLNLQNPGNIEIIVSNLLGIELLRYDELSIVSQFSKNIDLQKFPAGTYYVQVRTSDNVWNLMVVKQ